MARRQRAKDKLPARLQDAHDFMNATKCPSGKVKYIDRTAARGALARQRSGRKYGHNVCRKEYRCPHCGYHHLTSDKRREERQAS